MDVVKSFVLAIYEMVAGKYATMETFVRDIHVWSIRLGELMKVYT